MGLRPIAMICFAIATVGAICVLPARAQKSPANSVPDIGPAERSNFETITDRFGGDKSPSSATVVMAEVAMSEPVSPPSPSTPLGTPGASPAAAAQETQGTTLEIQNSYAEAVRQSQLHNRPLLALLGADWCVWCRKLEAELETQAAEPIFKEWVVVKVNVDNEPEVAARLQASALPALRILGPFQSLVASREGYLELAELKEWLAANRASADPALYKVLYDAAAPDEAATQQLVELLAQSSPLVRAAAMERLAAHPRRSAGALLQTLKTGRLVQQLCACEVLRRWNAPLGEIDPWQPETVETDEFPALLAWSRQRIEALDAAEPNESRSAAGETESAAATPEIDAAEAQLAPVKGQQ